MLPLIMRHGFFKLLFCCSLAACTPQVALLTSLLPDGTVPILLSNLQRVDDSNRQRLEDFERRGDWNGLTRFAEENLDKDKSNADWWLVAGYAHSRLGQHQRATECYVEAVRLTPEEATGWNLLAQSYRATGQPQRAISTLNNALLAIRDAPATFYLLGESYGDMGRFDLASVAYQEALKIDSGFAEAWFGMGRAYVRLGRLAEAREVITVLERLNPSLARELAAALAQGK
jgi:tetratricopeptide (TPR) repeat protein